MLLVLCLLVPLLKKVDLETGLQAAALGGSRHDC